MDETKQKILSFLKNHKLMVLSTLHADKEGVESAVVGFVETENIELFFGTSNTSRKYKNLQHNQHVSLVVGWDGAVGTLQYEGIAREVLNEEVTRYIDMLVAKNPYRERFLGKDDQRYFLIVPTWIRLVDMSAVPHATHEIKF